jgi:uncharacterized protein
LYNQNNPEKARRLLTQAGYRGEPVRYMAAHDAIAQHRLALEADEMQSALRMALEELGEDHILMATDYPHFDSEYPHTVSKLRANNLLTPTQKEKILGENARQLLKI